MSINYNAGLKFTAPSNAPYLAPNGSKCGRCVHFPLCSQVQDKNATADQDYCARPSRGFKAVG